MSSQKKRREGPMPASAAGLLRFFEDETEGIKIRPELVVIASVALMVISILLTLLGRSGILPAA